MTDRELLVFAFKAWAPGENYIRLVNDAGPDWWNPLRKDSDALRLAVKLSIDITFKAFGEDEVMTSASEDQFEGWFTEPYGTDKEAATRRAIVMAAAEIGRAMP